MLDGVDDGIWKPNAGKQLLPGLLPVLTVPLGDTVALGLAEDDDLVVELVEAPEILGVPFVHRFLLFERRFGAGERSIAGWRELSCRMCTGFNPRL